MSVQGNIGWKQCPGSTWNAQWGDEYYTV